MSGSPADSTFTCFSGPSESYTRQRVGMFTVALTSQPVPPGSLVTATSLSFTSERVIPNSPGPGIAPPSTVVAFGANTGNTGSTVTSGGASSSGGGTLIVSPTSGSSTSGTWGSSYSSASGSSSCSCPGAASVEEISRAPAPPGPSSARRGSDRGRPGSAIGITTDSRWLTVISCSAAVDAGVRGLAPVARSPSAEAPTSERAPLSRRAARASRCT